MASPLDSIGLSFAPGQNPNQQQPGSQDSAISPVQQAIKILSMRVPQNAGPGGITPNALLTGPGSAGLGAAGGGFDLMALLRRLLQPGGQSSAGPADAMPMPGPAGQMPSPSVPLPHVTPGEGGGPTNKPQVQPPMPMTPPPMGPPPGIGRGPFNREN